LRTTATRPQLPTLRDRFSAQSNSFGVLRLGLAFSVLVAHSWPLGLGKGSLGLKQTHGQIDVGSLAVQGFFVLSGFLVMASAARLTAPRFIWHRLLRIFPGLWVCLLVTAFLLAPAIALYERGTLDGFLDHPQGPSQWVWNNWFAITGQWGIADLLTTTPYGEAIDASVFNGSLWSLIYELNCYAAVAVLIVVGVVRHVPRLVPILAALAYLTIVSDFLTQMGDDLTASQLRRGLFTSVTVFAMDVHVFVYLAFLFLLGSSAQLFQHRVPVHPMLALGALVLFAASLRYGAFFVVGLPAYAYLLLWASCSLPKWLEPIGRNADYSYGIYIYAFPVQQIVALLGGTRYGVVGYIVLSTLGALMLAVCSWHLVERPAMRLKHWTPQLLRPRRNPPLKEGDRVNALRITRSPS
jgi:peptidoglycan/LPS O-acetylase OafA/YrhL